MDNESKKSLDNKLHKYKTRIRNLERENKTLMIKIDTQAKEITRLNTALSKSEDINDTRRLI